MAPIHSRVLTAESSISCEMTVSRAGMRGHPVVVVSVSGPAPVPSQPWWWAMDEMGLWLGVCPHALPVCSGFAKQSAPFNKGLSMGLKIGLKWSGGSGRTPQ